jgi:hypothetical protein
VRVDDGGLDSGPLANESKEAGELILANSGAT